MVNEHLHKLFVFAFIWSDFYEHVLITRLFLEYTKQMDNLNEACFISVGTFILQ